MSFKDVVNNVGIQSSVDPGDRTGTVNGSQVDLANAPGAMFVVATGSINGTTSIKAQESTDGGSSWSDVASGDLDGSFSDLSANEVQRVGYKGNARHVRIVSTAAGTSPSVWTALVVRTGHRKKPV